MPTKEARSPGDVAGHELPATTFHYDEEQVILYALGVGAGREPTDMEGLRFVYEKHPQGMRVLPTFATLFGQQAMWQLLGIPGLNLNPMMLLHGEQYLELEQPLPVAGSLTNSSTVAHVYDKGSGALFLVEVTSRDAEGNLVARNRYSVFVRGAGGFGGERGPARQHRALPTRPPDAVQEEPIPPGQALLYRLSGDRNPLHADPRVAALAGFERPVLHGLCTFGFAARAVLERLAARDVARFRNLRARFSQHVFPGETLRTEMWQDEATVTFQSKVKERDVVVLSDGVMTLR